MVDLVYRNEPKFSDRQIWANSVGPDQSSLIRIYSVCNSVCLFWTHYSWVKLSFSNFTMITAKFRVSEYFGILWYMYSHFMYLCLGKSVQVPCKQMSCKCKGFAWIPTRAEEVGEFWLQRRRDFDPSTWRAKCRCKHNHEEHEAAGMRRCRKGMRIFCLGKIISQSEKCTWFLGNATKTAVKSV